MQLTLISSTLAALVACGPIPVEQLESNRELDEWRWDLTPMERGQLLRVPAFHDQSETFKQDVTRLEIEPGEGMEFKYRLETGATFLYSWHSTAPLHVEMHSQPDDAPFLYANSLKQHDTLTESRGSFTAPYPGIHGWYWENRSIDIITVTVTSVGFYDESQEFRAEQPVVFRTIE